MEVEQKIENIENEIKMEKSYVNSEIKMNETRTLEFTGEKTITLKESMSKFPKDLINFEITEKCMNGKPKYFSSPINSQIANQIQERLNIGQKIISIQRINPNPEKYKNGMFVILNTIIDGRIWQGNILDIPPKQKINKTLIIIWFICNKFIWFYFIKFFK